MFGRTLSDYFGVTVTSRECFCCCGKRANWSLRQDASFKLFWREIESKASHRAPRPVSRIQNASLRQIDTLERDAGARGNRTWSRCTFAAARATVTTSNSKRTSTRSPGPSPSSSASRSVSHASADTHTHERTTTLYIARRYARSLSLETHTHTHTRTLDTHTRHTHSTHTKCHSALPKRSARETLSGKAPQRPQKPRPQTHDRRNPRLQYFIFNSLQRTLKPLDKYGYIHTYMQRRGRGIPSTKKRNDSDAKHV